MAKSTNKSSNMKDLIINNFSLVIPLVTYIVFKYFKEKFFEGKVIHFIELFHMIVGLTLVYSITLKNICDNKNSSVILKPIQYALILSLIINIINMLNPCKKYMTNMQSNILIAIVLIILFNAINFYITSQKDKHCKKQDNKFVVVFLLMLNIGLIYMK